MVDIDPQSWNNKLELQAGKNGVYFTLGKVGNKYKLNIWCLVVVHPGSDDHRRCRKPIKMVTKKKILTLNPGTLNWTLDRQKWYVFHFREIWKSIQIKDIY